MSSSKSANKMHRAGNLRDNASVPLAMPPPKLFVATTVGPLAAPDHPILEPFLESKAKSTSHPRGVDGTNAVLLALGNLPTITTTNRRRRMLRLALPN